ncbi:MAG: MFS transporter [Actinobacteria bacterium]|nr:MFS transporter [Actinomycetota bacterium]
MSGNRTPTTRTSPAIAGVWALFLAFAFLQVGNGLQRILLPIRGESEGIGAGAMGMVMAFHFGGYLLGAKVITRALRAVGHIRVFAALASTASTAVLVNAVLVTPLSWSIVYLVGGLCNAGVFVVLESWLNDRASNETRGKILGLYMMVMMGGTAGGQWLINVGAPEGFELFVLSSVLISLAVIPVTLSASSTPPMTTSETMPVREVYRTVPSAVIGLFFCSFVQSAATSMGAVYGIESGMSTAKVATFTSVAVIGAVVLQVPLGSLSDRYHRSAVIAIVATVSCVLAALGTVVPASGNLILLLNFAFGAFVFPLYGQFVALANDWIPPEKRLAAASAIVMVSGVGAVFSPMALAIAMEAFGPKGYYATLSAVLAALVVYLLVRIRMRAPMPVERQSKFQPILARSGEMAHSVSRWVRHPLDEWLARHGRRHVEGGDGS